MKENFKYYNYMIRGKLTKLRNYGVFKASGLSLIMAGILAGTILARELQTLNRKAAGTNVSLILPSSISLQPGETITLPVMLNTDGHAVTGVDVIINFDRNYLEVTSVRSRSDTSTLKTYLPQVNGQYSNQTATERANATGRIEFSAISFLAGAPTGSFNGTLGAANPLAQITFKATRNTNSTPVNFVYSSNSSTTDSNVMGASERADILGRVQNSNISIATTPTSTPTIRISPTFTPTPVPTATQAPAGDTERPTVRFENPSGDTKLRVNSEIRFLVNATDNVGVNKVQFYINGNWVHVEEDAPYTYTWTVPSAAGVTYTIMARALDNAGNASSSSIKITSTN